MPDSYNDLIKGAVAALSIDQDSQQHKNITSVITLWVRANGLTLESAVGDEFGKNFDDRIKKFGRSQAENHIAKSTIQSRTSWLRMVRKTNQRQNSLPLPDTFGARINHLITEAGYSVGKFAKHHLKGKCNPAVIRNWIKGSQPRKHANLVAEIEEIFQVSSGTLTDFLPMRKSTNNNHTTEYREKIKRIRRSFYVRTEKTNKEIDALIQFKSTRTLPSGMSRKGRWTTNTNGICYSAELFKILCADLFGFCCLPTDGDDPLWTGLGLTKDRLSLRLFAEINYCERYIEFKYLRSSNIYHQGISYFIAMATSLLRADTGYLWQNKDFAADAGLSVTDWQAKCIATRSRLFEIRKGIEEERNELGREGTYSRDPNLAVVAITDLSNPLGRMFDALDLMKRDLLCYDSTSLRSAVFARDLCLYSLLLANPLRINMFEKMRLNKNLVRDEAGAWWIVFKKQDFKNRSALKKDYKIRISPRFWTIIDEYVSHYRPILLGEKDSDYVFVGWHGETMSSRILSNRIFTLTTTYFPETPGFRAHAIRHIVATGIIKKDRKLGFYKASKVLHDKQETIEKNYAHLKTSEEFELYNDMLEGCEDDQKGAA